MSVCAADITKSCSIMPDSPITISEHYPLNIVPKNHTYDAYQDIQEWNVQIIDSLLPTADTLLNLQFRYEMWILTILRATDKTCSVPQSMCNSVVGIVHDSCNKVLSDIPDKNKGRFTQNNWWNSDWFMTRDRQRF